ncbi:hypothetical protein HHI36_017559, partial [Cryptolaemus montrouzieri]
MKKNLGLEESVVRIIQLNKLDDKDISVHGTLSYMERCGDICTERKCMDSRIRLPPIKRTESENITWDIRGICGISSLEIQPGLAVHRVELKRKEKHDNIMKEMTLRMADLNESIEQEIRKHGQSLVSNVHMIKDNVENILNNIQEKDCSCLTKKVKIRMQEILKQLNDNRLLKIDDYCNHLRNLEKQRSEGFKIILKNAYKEMNTNLYIMPYEIQKFFEKKVQHLNQVSMNNYHCYTELEEKLKLQMQDELSYWLKKLKLYEDNSEKKPTQDKSSPIPSLQVIEEENDAIDVKAEIMSKLREAEENYHQLKKLSTKLKCLKFHPLLETFESYLFEMANATVSIIQADLVDQKGVRLDFDAIRALSNMHCVDEEELE